MNFTREPIIESVITPREGCKLVVRNSRGSSQEDYFVDAVEVVSFGHSIFFRSLEKPKSFLVPVSDYEILELRETRMVLKHVPSERSVKISGGKDSPPRAHREHHAEPKHQEPKVEADATHESEEAQPVVNADGSPSTEVSVDRKRDGRRRRGRRGRSDRSQEPRVPNAAANEGTESTEEPNFNEATPSEQRSESPTESVVESNLESNEEVKREAKPETRQHTRSSSRQEPKVESSDDEANGEEKPVKAPSLLSRLFLPPPPKMLVRRLEPKVQETEKEDAPVVHKDLKTLEREFAAQQEEQEASSASESFPKSEDAKKKEEQTPYNSEDPKDFD